MKKNTILQNRWLLLAVSSVHVIATSGVVFGFAGLQHTLQLEGAFSQTCENGQKSCEKQSSLLNLMFVLGSSANYLSNIPFGYILDRFGPKACSIVASLSYLVGTICMILAALANVIATTTSSAAAGYLEYLYFVGFVLFGFAGPGVQVPTFHISNLFANSSLIIAVNTALFDASTMIFFLMQLVHEYLHLKVYFIFSIYAALICFIAVTGAVLWPNYTFEKQIGATKADGAAVGKEEDVELVTHRVIATTAAEEEEEGITMKQSQEGEKLEEASGGERLRQTESLEQLAAETQAKVIEHQLEEVNLSNIKATSAVVEEQHAVVEGGGDSHFVIGLVDPMSPGIPATTAKAASLHDQPFVRQLLSPVYPFIIMFGAFQILRLNFFVATIDAQLKSSFGATSSLSYTLKIIFEIMLPFGFVGIPVMSYLLNRSLFLSFLFVNIFALGYGVAFLIPVHIVLVIGFAIFSTCRQFVFSAIFTSIADKFGYRHFGKLIGINNLGVALFGLLQYPLVELVYRVLNGNFLWANVVLLVSGVVPLIVNLFLYKQLHGGKQIATSADNKKQVIMH